MEISYDRPDRFTIEKTHDNKLIFIVATVIEEIETETGQAFLYNVDRYEFPWSDALKTRIEKDPEAFLAKLKK